jgi:hypothetical protein
MGLARVRLDVCCNDPDNGIFAGRAEALQVETWDGESIEFMSARAPAPRFSELTGAIRLCRRNWPILAAKGGYGNWCWNAYWLQPSGLVELLATVKRAGQFHLDCGPTDLYENWNDAAVPLDHRLWLANLWGRHAIGEVAA